MKKILSLAAAALAAVGLLSACGNGAAGPPAPGASDPSIRIVATIFPEYDWIKNILGEDPAGAEVTLLLDSGVDPHSYQPTADDILKISDCDLFLYVGGESDAWVEDALKEAVNKEMIAVNLLEALGDAAMEEEHVEGMQEEEHEHGEEEEHADESGLDEHVWLSLKNASVLCGKITEALCRIDSDHADVYKKNLAAYQEKLEALDAEYQASVDAAAVHTLLFADRFPFRYMTEDYDLDYYAAFDGCAAETEASFETMAFLANKTDELSLHTILTIEGSDQRIAETVRSSTQKKDQQILTMDSMQGTTKGDVEGGATYLGAMEKNLDVLKEALKQK